MNVFDLRDRLIDDYSQYIGSFIRIRDRRIDQRVQDELRSGLLWPDPLIQLNPAFQSGSTIDALCEEGVLDPACSRIFRLDKTEDGGGRPLRLHAHQEQAIRTASGGNSYVLTTGTGSGKSLAYIVPIVDRVLRGTSGDHRVKAIIVYPMNALANSQEEELKKFLEPGFPPGRPPVRVARYTGQESKERKDEIIQDPPDVLLTNYMMLELILTRPDERRLVTAAEGLQFLVFDELHTYRGRQGADVAFLIRRLRDLVGSADLQCVGTSATLAGTGTAEEQARGVAQVASRLFGVPVAPENVIGETLRRSTMDLDPEDEAQQEALRRRVDVGPDEPPPSDFQALAYDPLCAWIESTFGLETASDDRLVRARPRSIEEAAADLAERTGQELDACRQIVRRTLLAGYGIQNPSTGFPAFAFRLHQFISRGDMVYASLEPEDRRFITVHPQRYVPGDRDRRLLPLVFCRECGQEYYCVRRERPDAGEPWTLADREPNDQLSDDGSEPGYLYLSTAAPWPTDPDEELERVPDDWREEHRGRTRLRRNRRDSLPQPVRVDGQGRWVSGSEGAADRPTVDAWWIAAPFRFCLRCGVAYSFRTRTDFGKVASLASEGRSTATTVLVLSVLRQLRDSRELEPEARKLLSFTDNRQDASLQAGHFNDFVEVTLVRGALYRALHSAGADGLGADEVAQRVADHLDLSFDAFAADPDVRFQAVAETHRALRDVLGYRIYRDLDRGWRVTSPSLEQCDLLRFDYVSLDELCAHEESWEGCHAALATATPDQRRRVALTLLDWMRWNLALSVGYLEEAEQDRIVQRSNSRLREPWLIDPEEKLQRSVRLFPRQRRRDEDDRADLFLGPRSNFVHYLRRRGHLPTETTLSTAEGVALAGELLDRLRTAGIVERAVLPRDQDDVPGYQINAQALRWYAGDGETPPQNFLRVPHASEDGAPPNRFFTRLYREVARHLENLRAREHTAQVVPQVRERRERRFKTAELPLLFCSPTMELGVDIAQLNVVNLRNVPPTPANYAQRSGRAGRSGQPALVFTYCTTGSPHDQYFFRRPELMVQGAVQPPRLELANEDLVRSHLHAVWLRESGLSLQGGLPQLLDLNGSPPALTLQSQVTAALHDTGARRRARERAERLLDSVRDDLARSDWWSEGWEGRVIQQVETSFEAACDRWRSLYRAAWIQSDTQHGVILDASRSGRDKARARELRDQADSQMRLLEAGRSGYSDFYAYRYFASEGFLPGYNFPRLPLSAFIPGRRRRTEDPEYLSRPRFLAISEFGPRALIYHEGERYQINRVILPAPEGEGPGALTRDVKICDHCGYLHPDPATADLCELCGNPFRQTLRRLFRLQNVSTVRRERINSDEEERRRVGYELRTTFRFEERGERARFRQGEIRRDGQVLGLLRYADAADLWRINLGWRRRQNRDQAGFVLDMERGYWGRNEQLADEDPEDPMSQRRERVVPYVEDHKNCLALMLPEGTTVEIAASLEAALEKAVQVEYQLEDGELASDRLPKRGEPRQLLFYEAAEGGAGALRQLVDDPQAVARVARLALELCHFDPEDGSERPHFLGNSDERCTAACYDCLLSYRNQPDHPYLDRLWARDSLLALAGAEVAVAPGTRPREEQVASLRRTADSDLEREWLDFLEEHGLRLPQRGQVLIEDCRVRPDFVYEHPTHLAIFVDGPHHDHDPRRRIDERQQTWLDQRGWEVVRFRYDERSSWLDRVRRYPSIFGEPRS